LQLRQDARQVASQQSRRRQTQSRKDRAFNFHLKSASFSGVLLEEADGVAPALVHEPEK
jgi:hypothetical protein